MSSTPQPRNDPDPVWHTGPLPAAAPALTAGEAEYHDYVHGMQMAGINGRAESDPHWAPPAWPTSASLEAGRTAENEAGREAEAGQ